MNLTLIDIVYPDRYTNQYLIEMFNIITFRRNNPLTFIPARRKNKIKNNEKYLICQRHHIIPQSYFKFHNISVDNSTNNIICLLKNEHIKIHRLLEQYYETKHIMNHETYFFMYANRKATNILRGIRKKSNNSWKSYSSEQKQKRCKNISIGTKKAMSLISNEKKEEQRKKLIDGIRTYMKNVPIDIRNNQKRKIREYHLGSIIMSNEKLHQFRYVCKNDIQTYLNNGWVKGNKSKEWLAQGYIKIKPGKFDKIDKSA